MWLDVVDNSSRLNLMALQFYHKVVEESLHSLAKEWDKAHTEVDRILSNFENTVHKLRDTELHAAHCAGMTVRKVSSHFCSNCLFALRVRILAHA